jgi:hypothetical protein
LCWQGARKWQKIGTKQHNRIRHILIGSLGWARGNPGAIGRKLGISLRNVGEKSSIVTFDLVNVAVE